MIYKSFLLTILLSQVKDTKSTDQGIFHNIMGERSHLVCNLTSLPYGFRTVDNNTKVNYLEYLINSQLNASYKNLVLGTYSIYFIFPSQPILPRDMLTGIYCITEIYTTLTSYMLINLQSQNHDPGIST